MIKTTKLDTDEIDFKIACLLKENARLSYKAIGEKVSLSASSVYERIKKMEGHGIIKKYGADIDWEKFGYAIHVFILLKDDKILGQLPDFLREKDEVLNCWMVSGEYDYMIEIRVANTKKLGDWVDYLYYNIGRTRTFIIIKDVFYLGVADKEKCPHLAGSVAFDDE